MRCSCSSWIHFFLQVIVLEKGGFTPAAKLSLREGDTFEDMYEMGSFLTTQDAGGDIL
jgi:hypothetical protein